MFEKIVRRHFFPEEDDKFLERVRAVVEEEEHQAMAAAEIDAAKGAIATAGESRKAIQSSGLHSKVQVMIKMERVKVTKMRARRI
ncbi:hypothetical protein Peur_048136 [Populus x canadensis]